jgi:multidrug efflux pump subunit AcrA (membrane-fusion protein)
VLRLEGELDPQTRTAQLLIEIDAESEQPGSGLPLLPGANVEVVIEGRSIEQAITIPRVALRDGTRVWLVDDDGELAERAVTVGWRERDSVVVTAGLEPGERVVTSPIATPIVGMLVEPMNVGTREVRDEER